MLTAIILSCAVSNNSNATITEHRYIVHTYYRIDMYASTIYIVLNFIMHLWSGDEAILFLILLSCIFDQYMKAYNY